MFIPGSEHLKRLELLGKKLSPRTIQDYRNYINLIVKKFGNICIEDLNIPMVNGYLMNLEKSRSWKNSYLDTINHIYKEAPWHCNYTITKPDFPRFASNSKKADIFTSEELSRFFDGANWTDSLRDYLVFLVMASCGLRLGEARALRVKQFIPEKHALVIDGFCERNGNRTNYNKKGSNEDQKLRVTLVPDTTQRVVMNYIKANGYNSDDFYFSKRLWKTFKTRISGKCIP